MIARVAREHGRSISGVASDSYALTLWTLLQSEESARLDRLLFERGQIELAGMIATGYHDPKQLIRYERNWRVQFTSTEAYRENALRAGAELLARHKRLTEAAGEPTPLEH